MLLWSISELLQGERRWIRGTRDRCHRAPKPAKRPPLCQSFEIERSASIYLDFHGTGCATRWVGVGECVGTTPSFFSFLLVCVTK